MPMWLLLVLPLVLEILVVVGSIGYISFRQGKKAAKEVNIHPIGQVASQVQKDIKEYLSRIHRINEINADGVKLGELKLQNLPSIEKHIWHQMQKIEAVYKIMLLTDQGELVGVERLDEQRFQVQVAGEQTGNAIAIYTRNQESDRTLLQQTELKLYPRDLVSVRGGCRGRQME